jgi:RNA polymerase sigma factor (sigma-70 family)
MPACHAGGRHVPFRTDSQRSALNRSSRGGLCSKLLLADLEERGGGNQSVPKAETPIKALRGKRDSAESTSALFEQVWKENEQHLLKVCLRKLGDVSDAEDALANVSLTVMEKLPEAYGRVVNLRAWLVQVVVNHCVDVQRRRQRQRRIFVSDPLDNGDDLWPAADSSTPEQQLLEQQLWATAHSLIQALPSMLQEVAVPYFLRHLSYPEIASNLGLTQDNVRKRIQKARAILWQQFLPHLD